MAGIKGNKGHANRTSFPNQKNNTKPPKVIIRKAVKMVKLAQEDKDILCFQDACYAIGWRSSKFDYWMKKIPILENIKKDVQNAIVRRINKKALESDYHATASIWRMKQLGERESTNIDHTTGGEKINEVDYSKLPQSALEAIVSASAKGDE